MNLPLLHNILYKRGIQNMSTPKKEVEMRREQREVIVSLTDWHVPYHSEQSVKVAFEFCRLVNPQIIIIHEVVDFYALSKYCKDPRRALELQAELDMAHKLLVELRITCPDAKIVMLESNHDRRLQKFLDSQAQALRYLDCLEFKNLLGLDAIGISYEKCFTFRDVLFKHGDIVRKFAGYTAKGELEKEGMSVVFGHTHRIGMHFRTLRGGSYVAIESGCLCNTNPDYIEGTADWQNGLSVISFRKKSKHFQPAVVPIIDGEILWGKTTIR